MKSFFCIRKNKSDVENWNSVNRNNIDRWSIQTQLMYVPMNGYDVSNCLDTIYDLNKSKSYVPNH